MEVWKEIEGYEGMYSVSTPGNVYSIRSGKLLKPNKDHGGYLYVSLFNHCKQKCAKIHRLVAEAFIKNPETKRTVNHIDGNKENNCVENLEWATHSENIIHANKSGLRVVTDAQRKAASENGSKTCAMNRPKKRVYAIRLNEEQGIEKHEFESAHEGARFVSGSASAIVRCCKGKQNIHKGYEWGYCDAN